MLLDRLNAFNQRYPWSHNDHYGRWVARQVTGARHVLDLGCGTGNLIARLRRHATTVTGIEPDPATAAVAKRRFADDPAVAIEQNTFDDSDSRRWDAITLVAVLHHLPLEETLRALRERLEPGGKLVIVGCHREYQHTVLELFAVIANPVIGFLKNPARHQPVHMTAPTADPKETLPEIRAVAARVLPGARIRRRVFWRYTLVWTDKLASWRP